MKKTVREIARRKNLPANLPRYIDGMMGRYLEFSAVRLALNYHVFCDMQRENAGRTMISDEWLSRFWQLMGNVPGILAVENSDSENPAGNYSPKNSDSKNSGGSLRANTDSEKPEGSSRKNSDAENLLRDQSGASSLESVNAEDFDATIRALLTETESLRSAVADRMQTLTAYTDIFHLYEYVLNRVEYRFREGSLPENYSDEAFCREIMKYIVRDEEPAEVNRKIGEILGQLPIRLTKQKFFELLDAGLTTYMGTDRSGLDDFLYMIRMSAMLEEPKNVSEEFAHLSLAKEEFRVCDYANITADEYHHLSDRMKEISDYLNETSEQYTLLMEQLNDIYVVLKSCEAKSRTEADVIGACEKIMRSSGSLRGNLEGISSVSESAAGDSEINGESGCVADDSKPNAESGSTADDSNPGAESPEISEMNTREDLLDLLVSLEGVQERLSDELGTYGYLMDDLYDGDLEELTRLGFSEAFHDLKDMESLTSSSIFVNLNAKDVGEITVDEDYIGQKKEILHSDMNQLFADNSRLVRRAVMATVISQLPVFFENLNAMQDFVFQSLAQCRDEAEKIACVEVISSILTETVERNG